MSKSHDLINEMTKLAASNATRDQQYEKAIAHFAKFMSEIHECYADVSESAKHVRSDLGRLEDELTAGRHKLHQSNPGHALLGYVHDLSRRARASL